MPPPRTPAALPGAELPFVLRAFTAHGVQLSLRFGATQANGDCPLCGKPGKLYASAETGRWDCKSCGADGNPLTFLRQFYDECGRATPRQAYEALAADRGLRDPATLPAWGVVRSTLTGRWLVAGYSPDGRLHQLYRYTRVKNESTGVWSNRLLPTPGVWPDGKVHGLHLPAGDLDARRPGVDAAEGPWDGMAWWEALRGLRVDGGELVPTANPDASLAAAVNVVAAPGANVWQDCWSPLCSGKAARLLYDNDHPRVHPKTGAVLEPPGYAGMRRVARLLASCGDGAPSSVHYLAWGGAGASHDPGLPDGHDLRDVLRAVPDPAAAVAGILDRVAPAPADWLPGRGAAAVASGDPAAEPLPCSDWGTLRAAWRRAFKWTDGLDRALSVMLACAASTRIAKDQLWVKVISPPSGGKTTLCEGLTVCRRYVVPRDTITGLFSGYQQDKEGTENLSFALQVKDMTLVVKDADPFMKSPNKDKIMGQLRGMYDRALRTQFGNKMSANHEGLNTTVIFCGTEKMREEFDDSELGQRFLDCVIMDTIDDEAEDEIGWKALGGLYDSRAVEVNGKPHKADEAALGEAKRLTGGYVQYLRESAAALLYNVTFDDDAKRRCMALGKFVAFMRSRPPRRKDAESSSREMSTRLRVQLGKLALCLAVVLNKESADAEVMRRVHAVSLDTARGKILDFCLWLLPARGRGVGWEGVTAYFADDEDKVRGTARHLRKIGVLEYHTPPGEPKRLWRLTDKFRALLTEVVGGGEEEEDDDAEG